MTDQITISRHDDAGRYVARIAGIDAEAELTFTSPRPGVVSADHTGVPGPMAGRGVARALLDALLEDARKSGFRILPACSFVAKQAERHPEWADLFISGKAS